MTFHQPQIRYAQSPYARIPLPRQYAQPPALDPILSGTVISWSVSDHPSTAVTQMALPYGQVWQNRPATSPCTSSLTIWSGPSNDRPIVIVNDPYVTIGDVLRGVYHMIRHVAQEHYHPTPQPLLLHPPYGAQPQPTPVFSEQQMRQWALSYLNGRFTWKGLTFHDVDSLWLEIR